MWKAVDRLLDEALTTEQFPGCAFAVGQRDKVLYKKTCGLLAKDGEKAVSSRTCPSRRRLISSSSQRSTLSMTIRSSW